LRSRQWVFIPDLAAGLSKCRIAMAALKFLLSAVSSAARAGTVKSAAIKIATPPDNQMFAHVWACAAALRSRCVHGRATIAVAAVARPGGAGACYVLSARLGGDEVSRMLPKAMKAVLLKGHGGFDQLEYREDVAVPLPADGEVLIRVGAAAINNTDVNSRTGWYSKSVTLGSGPGTGHAESSGEDSGWTGAPLAFPRIQGADACGRIVAVGFGVDPGRIGERVLVDPVLRTPGAPPLDATYFGSDRDGAFAQFATLPQANACCIASELSDIELASFPCSYAAAENMLTRAAVRAGQTVLITGASGGVGSAAVQLAKRRGAAVLALASPSKAAALATIGADVVLSRDTDLVAALGRETVDVVVDVVGGGQFPQLLKVLRRGGRLAAAGAISGPMVELDLRTLYLKDLTILGCTILEPGIFSNLIGYIERAEIVPLVSATYPLRAIVDAQTAFLAKLHVGKIVLVP
jgi:NADPH:quinone reductase-like Zn-dependent oxidoreductase